MLTDIQNDFKRAILAGIPAQLAERHADERSAR